MYGVASILSGLIIGFLGMKIIFLLSGALELMSVVVISKQVGRRKRI
jgi:hypothetical protein